MTETHYRKAPIVEAVIDLRVRFGEEPTFDALKRGAATLKQRFPVQEDLAQVQVAFKLGEVGKKKAGSNLGQRRIGVRLRTGDSSRVLQLQQGGFAYSHLAPYTDWSTFRAEAHECWSIYKRLFKPAAVTRYALRFINRIDVPNDLDDCSLFTSLYPCVPRSLGDKLERYFMQLSFPQPQVDRNAQLLINSSLVEGGQTGGAGLMLDFDLFAPTELDADSDEVWRNLDAFRVRKNEIFEACITNHTRRLIA